jgi:hypothetical protein
MKNSTTRLIDHRPRRTRLALSFGATALVLASLTIASGAATSAAVRPLAASAPCATSVSAGTGTVAGSLILGVTAGTTKVTFDCNTSASPSIVAEASLLDAIGTSTVSETSEADIASLGSFTASTTDTGCPAAVAGQCTIATFTVPAAFSASDAKATCPPSQAEINVGLFGCAIAVATAAEQPVDEFLMTYASETTPPNPPTISATPTTGAPGGVINVSDSSGNTGYWWANAIQMSQAQALGAAATAAPPSCSGSAYGTVPAALLAVNWFPAGSTTAIAGSAVNVSISNDCYDGTTLHAPVLSGTIPVPASVTVGTTYTVYLCETNFTPEPSNDAQAAAHCGAGSWIDQSFAVTAVSGIAQSALTLTSVSGVLGVPLTLTSSGGSGTGAVSFSVADGTASGCLITTGVLSATGAGTCLVTATKAGDSTYLPVSSTATAVALSAGHVTKLVTRSVALSSFASKLPLKISCKESKCVGQISVSAKITRRSLSDVTIVFATGAYSIGANTTKTVVTHLTSGARLFIATFVDHPPLSGIVNVTDNLGKKHTYIGRVSLLK